jgi:ankyrin repeat protein
MLLKAGADPEAKALKLGSTPLQWATYCGIKTAPGMDARKNAKTIRALLDGGARYDLHSAVANRDLARVKAILAKRPAAARAKALHGFTALHVNADAEIGAWLLRKGAQVDARADDGTTPLMKLCNRLRADLAVARLYLEAGADANARNDKGRTALHGAARRGQAGIAALLLEYGADPRARNAKGETPRQKAARLRQRAVVSALESAR